VAVENYVCSRIRDPNDAADIVQECFLRAWRWIGRAREETNPRAWLLAIANNLCNDFISVGGSGACDEDE